MRKIIFKGRRLDNKKWALGDLLQFQDAVFIHTYENGCRVSHKIDEASICQYTDVTDRNGKQIFEGDRVRTPMHRSDWRDTIFMDGTVEWKNGAFHVKWDIKDYGRHFLGYLEDVEVIGNVFDENSV